MNKKKCDWIDLNIRWWPLPLHWFGYSVQLCPISTYRNSLGIISFITSVILTCNGEGHSKIYIKFYLCIANFIVAKQNSRRW